MRALFIFEFKKIAKRRMNIIVMVVCTGLIAALFALPVKQYTVLDTDGKQLAGGEAIRHEKIYENTFAGKLTNKKIRADIAAYQALFDDPQNISQDSETKKLNDKAYYKYFFPYYSYWKLINGNYTKPTLFDSSFSEITNMNLEDGFDFYGSREEKINVLLNQTYVDWNFSESEKAFWMNRAAAIEIPIEYSCHTGWETLLNCSELFIIAIVAICICVSSVFSGEYQSGAASIILSSQYGKSKLATAKVWAAFVYSFAVFTLFIAIGCGIQLFFFGFDGWDLPVQVLNTISPYPVSLSGATLLVIATLYLILFGMISVSLLLSAKMRSTVPVLVIIILLMMLPMFLGISETSGTWNRILVLLPYRAMQAVFADEFFGYFAYPVGHFIFDIVTIRIVVYALLVLICIPLAKKTWKKHQIM